MPLFHVILLVLAFVAVPLSQRGEPLFPPPEPLPLAGNILNGAEMCFQIEEPIELLVGASAGVPCPEVEDILADIEYAKSVFGDGDAGSTVVVFTQGAFDCGGLASQGCTGYDDAIGPGLMFMVVSDVERGYRGVTAHEFGHVLQIRNGTAAPGGDHLPADQWAKVNAYRGN